MASPGSSPTNASAARCANSSLGADLVLARIALTTAMPTSAGRRTLTTPDPSSGRRGGEGPLALLGHRVGCTRPAERLGELLDLGCRRPARHLQPGLLQFGRRHPGDGAHLRPRERAVGERRPDRQQVLEGDGDAHVLAGGDATEVALPPEPMRSRRALLRLPARLRTNSASAARNVALIAVSWAAQETSSASSRSLDIAVHSVLVGPVGSGGSIESVTLTASS